MLPDYFHHLRTWKRQYAPQQPEDEWHPLFVEALQRESHIEYLLDVLLYGTAEEKKALVAEQRKEVIRLEQRFAEHPDGYAELSKARDEAKQLQIYKANAEMLLRTDTEEQRQTRERQQENSTALQSAAEREPFVQSGVWGEFPQQAKGDFRMPEISLFIKFV